MWPLWGLLSSDSLENWHGILRYEFDAFVTKQDFNDTYVECMVSALNRGGQRHILCCLLLLPPRYLPAFEACVRDGNSSGIMCSYNAVRNRVCVGGAPAS
mgnify:CR=1 FL=1